MRRAPRFPRSIARNKKPSSASLKDGACTQIFGQYTSQVNKNVNKNSIYSIEPHSVKFEKLKINCCDLENSSYNNIYPLKIALSDHDGSIKLERNNLSNESIIADSYKLDTLFKIIKPDLIKIDVTGQELEILKGSIQILQQGRAKFLIALDREINSQSSNSES